jgi:hypothetical protein
MLGMTIAELSERYNAGERNFAGIKLYKSPESSSIVKLHDIIF